MQGRLAEGLAAALAARSSSAVGHALHAYSSIGDAEGAQVGSCTQDACQQDLAEYSKIVSSSMRSVFGAAAAGKPLNNATLS